MRLQRFFYIFNYATNKNTMTYFTAPIFTQKNPYLLFPKQEKL